MKAFVLAFYDPQLEERAMVGFLDNRPEILNWLTLLPNTVFITSNRTVRTLAKIISNRFPETFFIILEYESWKADGGLTEEAWEFLNNPKSA